MGTKVRKKGSDRSKVSAQVRKLWLKAKQAKNHTFFALVIETGISEGTLRNAFRGYASTETIKALNTALGIKETAHEQATN